VRSLPTPRALLDREVVDRNTAAMAARAAEHGVALRPHVKTHKCAEVAALQLRGQPGGITASTLGEAVWFAERGMDDVTLAVPCAPGRAVAALAAAGHMRRLGLLVDSDAAVTAIERAAEQAGRSAAVLLKVDCGYGRAGVDPDDADAVQLARRLADSRWLTFEGVLSHAGHSYSCTSVAAVREVAAAERAVTVGFADRLRGAGVPVDVVSVGSTPTAVHGADWAGVTELRPGNYALFDVFQVGIGSCSMHDVAVTVLTEVIGVHPARSQVIVDAGALALSKDVGPRHVDPDCGFGAVLDLQRRPLPLRVHSLSQEHGVLRVLDPRFFARIGVGDRLRIAPNHSCLTAALYDEYVVLEGGGAPDRDLGARAIALIRR